MACDLTTIQTEACTSGIGKVTDTIELLQLIAQLTCEAGQTLGVAGNPSLPLSSVQFNDGGLFGGDADFTWNKTANELSILGNVGIGVAASSHLLQVQIAANEYVAIGDMLGLLGYVGTPDVTVGIGFSRSTNGVIVGGIFNFDDSAGTPSIGIQAREDIQFINNALQTVIIKSNGFVGVGTALPVAPIHVGSDINFAASYDPAILIARPVSDANGPGSAHGFVDMPRITRIGTGLGYASFDARALYEGDKNYDHNVGVQSIPVFTSSGTISHVYGLYHSPIFNTGVVTNSYGIQINDPAGVGTLTNNYGIKINAMTRGAALNYGIYVDGSTTQNFFAGTVRIGKLLTLEGGAQLLATTAALTNGAAAALGTLTNAPAVGNPTKWIAIDDAGTVRYIPAW